MVTNEQLIEMAEGALKPVKEIVHRETVIREDKFRDPIYMTSEEGRQQTSDWALATKEELEKAIKDIHKLAEEGKFEAWYEENCQALLDKHGQASTLVLQK